MFADVCVSKNRGNIIVGDDVRCFIYTKCGLYVGLYLLELRCAFYMRCGTYVTLYLLHVKCVVLYLLNVRLVVM